MEDMIITMAFSILFNSIKSAAAKAKFRAAFLKAFNLIRNAYPGDPDFQ